MNRKLEPKARPEDIENHIKTALFYQNQPIWQGNFCKLKETSIKKVVDGEKIILKIEN